ncbi:MAG: hypothetical protein MUE37_09215 [Bacteroidales bacterium]|nr:hypothetical protein [Bacteroidales bacterium]
MWKKTILPIVFLCITIPVLSGQANFKKGYIITVEGDTLHGLVDLRGDRYNSANCTFTEGPVAEAVTFEPGSLLGYGFEDGRRYLSKSVDSESGYQLFFMEVLLDGILDLFYYRSADNDSYYFVETAKGEFLGLTEKQRMVSDPELGKGIIRTKYYVGTLRYAMSDAPELSPDIERLSLKQNELVKLIQRYHEIVCTGEPCIKFIKSYQAVRLRFAPFVNWQAEFLKIKGQTMFAGLDYSPTYYPSAGFSMEISNPGINERLSVSTDISLGRRYFYGFGITEYNTTKNYLEAHLNHTVLKGVIRMTYAWPSGRFRPLFSGGFSLQKNIVSDQRMEVDRVTPGLIVPETIYTGNWSEPWFGFNAGAGFKTAFRYSGDFYCHIQYRFLSYIEDFSAMSSIGLTAGILF